MNPTVFHVRSSDLAGLPVPDRGYHEVIVHAVRTSPTASGDEALRVVFHLPEAPAECDRVTDFFCLNDANPRASYVSRRRLMSLVRACGMEPQEGQDIRLNELVGQRLQVCIEHETYGGAKRARVVSYAVLE